MNNLPESIVTKIMLYDSHPAADLIEGTSVFNYMELMRRSENTYMITHGVIYQPGGFKTAFECGTLDRVYNQRKRIRINNKYKNNNDLTKEERH